MRFAIILGSALAMAACATGRAYPPESPRAWLPRDLARSTTVQKASNYDPTHVGVSRYSITLNGCDAALVSQGFETRDAGAARSGTTRYNLSLDGLRANAEGNAIRILPAQPARGFDSSRDARMETRALWSQAGIVVQTTSLEAAARVAGGLNALAAECSATQ